MFISFYFTLKQFGECYCATDNIITGKTKFRQWLKLEHDSKTTFESFNLECLTL